MHKFNLTRAFFRDVWYLTKSYWQSEEKKKAFLLLGCIVALTLGIVFMLVQLNHWNNSFYSALQNYQTEKIFDELLRFTGLAFVYIILAVYSYYLQQMLILNWRRWLTERFIDIWMKNKTYYHLQMFGKDTDNPDQRISEDVRLFVEMTLGFSIGILKAVCTFASFVVILYNLSGPLTFTFMGTKWTINGYMFWASLVYSIIGTYITHIVGRKLVQLNFIQQRYEADFRFSMIRLRESAESVAFYRGEKQEGGVFKERFTLLLDNFWKLITKQKQLVWLNSGYSQIAIIFPFVAVMNRYLAKEITLGGLMQVSSAFGNVQGALSYFVDMYTSIAQWQAVVMRLTFFGRHMQEVSADAERFHLERFATAQALSVERMQINLPDGTPLLKDISFNLQPGKNVLIKGVSGSGKSTMLRAISGIWPFVEGKINLPELKSLMFIPQKPYIPLGTLRDAMLYPGNKQVSDAELVEYLHTCQIGYLADKLEAVADWSHVLSVGEQQRLAFARAHIQQPIWLFLDEATSALDEETEAAMYGLLAERLQGTTVVSVGHRSTLNRYHQLVLRLDKQNKSVSLENFKGEFYMQPLQIAKDIYDVGVQDWAVRDFHGYKTERGATYNSYLIMDEKITLIDTVKAPFTEELVRNISKITDPANIDYIVINHVEPDHSGAMPALTKLCPKAKFVITLQGKNEAIQHYGDIFDFEVVKDMATLNIGQRTLTFVMMTMLHWPDSMATYSAADEILFSNDAFGEHYATSKRFDDEVDQEELFYEAKKYFANILFPYAKLIGKALTKVSGLPIKMIAPSHGVIWRSNIAKIVDCYGKWGNGVQDGSLVIAYDSMWGGTEKIARAMARGAAAAGTKVKVFKMSCTPNSTVAAEIFTASGVLLGSSTLNCTMLPNMASLVIYLKGLAPVGKKFATFGTMGWAGGAQKDIEEILGKCVEFAPGFKCKWTPQEAELAVAEQYAYEFAKGLQE